MPKSAEGKHNRYLVIIIILLIVILLSILMFKIKSHQHVRQVNISNLTTTTHKEVEKEIESNKSIKNIQNISISKIKKINKTKELKRQNITYITYPKGYDMFTYICYDIKDKEEKKDCIEAQRLVRAEHHVNVTECLKLKKRNYRSICIIDIAEILNKPEYCNLLPKEDQEFCYSNIAFATKNKTMCFEKLNAKEAKECVDRIKSREAYENLDINACLAVETLEYQNLCFEQIASYYGPAYCYSFNNESLKDRCLSILYFNFACAHKDQKICEKIPLENYKKVCKIRLKHKEEEWIDIDSDGDGVDDGNELFLGTDPFNPDH